MTLITMEKDGFVALAKINHPPANALSSKLIEEVDQLLTKVEQDEHVRVVILYGEGRFFSAGADIKEFTSVESGEAFSKMSANGQKVFERLENFPKPVIASIHGAALGGGLELAMACHIRLVTKSSKLGLPELQLGLIPGFAGTQRLPRLVGVAKAAEMMLTSDPISGEHAVQWGLANHAFDDEELMENTLNFAKKLANKSPIAVKHALHMLSYSKNQSFYDGVEAEAKSFGEVFGSNDAKEGIQAFIEKRQPTFTGK
ncbi:enoyl-CoA hydratase [Sporosarcina sp. PTS2304]|uniref:enoyl-CoA hydratase n=1 Tax=Sporosarcina sp. PTS2304 TaxID=2283194 RepID=UPI000E0CDC50|nr:enoyl-CoA hydratase [Sporosarcina sp. PTS2304]AXH99385.1 enoyl-CoA hydratase [Sporosarcina sp. PTS2304]